MHYVVGILRPYVLGFPFILYAGIVAQQGIVLYLAIGVVLAEGIVLVLNDWRCPLAALAQQYGDEMGRVSDMFVPEWFVPCVFPFCGILFAIGILILVLRLVLLQVT